VVTRRFARSKLVFSQLTAISALNPNPRLKPRFVFGSASIGLSWYRPPRDRTFPLFQEDWGYRHFQSSADKRTMVSADFSNEFSVLRLGTVVFMSSTPFSQDLNGFAIEF
jgi:hypothetical protein